MNEFKTYHPIVNFVYFVFVIGFSMFFMNPVCLMVSLFCGFLYSVILKGKKSIKKNLMYMIPMFLLMSVINPLFNHQGTTIIEYFPSGNPLTLESIVYGTAVASMMAGVIFWFSCYNDVMTSDKFLYLFGKIIPTLSLIVSMVLRFVPRFLTQMKEVSRAQKALGKEPSGRSIIRRARYGLSILSILTTRSLENSIETADSMKSRGYGMKGRTAFSTYIFDKRDKKGLLNIILLGGYTLFGSISGGIDFSYFPTMTGIKWSLFGLSIYASYFILCMYPIIIEVREAIRWKALKSKM